MFEASARDPEIDDRCPLCEAPIVEEAASEYCDACGCLLIERTPGAGAADALPPGVARRAAPALTEGDAGDPYRVAAANVGLDLLVSHRERPFRAAIASPALFFVGIVGVVGGSQLSAAMHGAIAALVAGGIAWSLIPRTSVTRFLATTEGLTVVAEGAPLSHGQRFDADALVGVFIRALARAELPEDRRLELVLVDRQGGRHSLLRGLDDPATMAWIAGHLGRALGFEDSTDRR
jgi:hypothetical protein